jgi:glutathione S-transferase
LIILYTFGPAMGLPDPSPFVLKARLLLTFAGLPFVEDRNGFGRAPKGKLPYLRDEGAIVADSTFIRLHIERKYRFDFDQGLDAGQRGAAWAIEKMCEEHLYWALVDARWMDDSAFNQGAARFFDRVPAPVRPVVKALVRRKVRSTLWRQGFGRHTTAEIGELAARDLAALAGVLGGKPFLMGETPCGADATVAAFVAGIATPPFDTPLRTIARRHPSLIAYADRVLQRYGPGGSEAGRRAA